MVDASKLAAQSLLDVAVAADVAATESGMDTTEMIAADRAARRTGTEIVTYEGEYRKARPRGGPGAMYTPQTIDVVPASRGNGVLQKVPGWGTSKAQGSTLKTARVSINSIDTIEAFKATRAKTETGAITGTSAIEIADLTLNVPIAAGVTTYLEAWAGIELAGESATTAFEVMIQIGKDNATTGKVAYDLETAGAYGDPLYTGGDTAWHFPVVEHSRLMLGTDADQEGGVPVLVRVRKFTLQPSSGGGTTPPATAARFKTGDQWEAIDVANVRSGPGFAYGAFDQLDKGQRGTIANTATYGAPVRADDHTWWRLNSPAGWVSESLLRNVTPVATTDPATSRMRSGWLRVKRTPV